MEYMVPNAKSLRQGSMEFVSPSEGEPASIFGTFDVCDSDTKGQKATYRSLLRLQLVICGRYVLTMPNYLPN